MSTPEDMGRLERIVRRLIEQTEADQLTWERAAMPDAWAVNIEDSRFRIRREGGEQAIYTLDLMGPQPEIISAASPVWVELLERLHGIASDNARRHKSDYLGTIETALGLDEPMAPQPNH